jgi:hypothetical protein
MSMVGLWGMQGQRTPYTNYYCKITPTAYLGLIPHERPISVAACPILRSLLCADGLQSVTACKQTRCRLVAASRVEVIDEVGAVSELVPTAQPAGREGRLRPEHRDTLLSPALSMPTAHEYPTSYAFW